MARNQHVVPRGGRWAVRGAGNRKNTRLFDRQVDAIAHGRKLARSGRGELVIHGADGRIRAKSSYGRGPVPPRS
ncbi:MAG: DUF2188 domain-containing protein [Longimicrobiaceae bacterium]